MLRAKSEQGGKSVVITRMLASQFAELAFAATGKIERDLETNTFYDKWSQFISSDLSNLFP
jgi:hypothetical protein